MIEKLNSTSEGKTLFQTERKINSLNCTHTKTKFIVSEKRSLKQQYVAFGDHENSSCESYKILGRHLDLKLNFQNHCMLQQYSHNTGMFHKFSATLSKGQLIQYIRKYKSPLVQYDVYVFICYAQRLNCTQLSHFEKIWIALKLPIIASLTEKFKNLKI